MTIQEQMASQLIANDMFDSQAKQVMEKVVAEQQETMSGRWQDDTSDYPAVMINTLWLIVKKTALDWLNENAPQAWFKPMFE